MTKQVWIVRWLRFEKERPSRQRAIARWDQA
jgi:hypothetical protein